ncbi:MAG: amidohydrolase [Phycisphaerales bacterium]
MNHTHLRDAHLHLLPYGASLAQIDLSRATSVHEALALIAAEARRRRDDPDAQRTLHPWIIGYAYRAEATRERRFPTRAELDEAAGNAPAIINSFDMHAASASSAILRAAGIDVRTPDPPGGAIQRDPNTGEPTGYLLETARFLLRDAEPKPTPERRMGELRASLDDLSARGFVELHDMYATAGLAESLLELDERDELSHTVWMYAVPECIADLEDIMRRRTPDGRTSPSGRIRFAGLKLFTDGTLNSRTASMLEPFADPIEAHPRGTPLFTDDRLAQHFLWARERGHAIATHAIGDAAVRQVLDCWESVSSGGTSSGGTGLRPVSSASSLTNNIPPLRIEHAQFIHPDDIDRFPSLGIVASMQPCHLLPDMEALQRLTPHAIDRVFPLRDLIDVAHRHNTDPADLIWLGSDAPVVPPAPADNIQAAVHRRRADTPPSAAIAPRQAIDESLALTLSRSRAAHA